MKQRSDASATPQQDLTDEERCRALVREMYATPEGRAVLLAAFGPLSEMTKDERDAAFDRYKAHLDRVTDVTDETNV